VTLESVCDGRAKGGRGLAEEATSLRNESATGFTTCVALRHRELGRLQVW